MLLPNSQHKEWLPKNYSISPKDIEREGKPQYGLRYQALGK